jgi:hypothetical protein
MISTLIKEHLPEWLEAGAIVMTLVVGAISASSITLYKVDKLTDDVAEIRAAVEHVPVLIEKQENTEGDIAELKDDVKFLIREEIGDNGEER